MAMQVGKLIVGADVAKAELVIHHDDRDEIIRLKNSKLEIRRWLKQQPLNTAIAVEATNVYHLDLVELAHSLGFEVYVIDGFQLSNYRKSVGGRVKTRPPPMLGCCPVFKNEGEDFALEPASRCLRQASEPLATQSRFGDCSYCIDSELGLTKAF
ncbi:hypothetical protein [Pseudomonas putida]|uniref:hypothetical protein n=1 Tax=Pseudomonas putida TaxID=303 RepID=UPI0002173FA8|nr:hypothetical protein [Pseudomonas putida]AEJ13370.1 ISPpu10, transposase [Pseudomonas putida S16]